MSYVLHILAAVAAIAAAELGALAPGAETGSAARAVPIVLLLAVPHCLGWLAHRLLVAGRLRWALAIERAVSLAPPVLFAVAVLVFGWLGALEHSFGVVAELTPWPTFGLGLALVPYGMFELAAIDARARLFARGEAGVRRARAFQVRLALSGFAPFALFFLLTATIGRSEQLRVRLEEVALYHAAFTLVLLVGFVFLLPAILRNTWSTTPLERGGLRTLLEGVADHAGFRCRELLVWRTGHQMANAAIVGLTPKSRMVFLSDALLESLGPREIAAVFAHEVGHAKRHHAMIFGSFALALFLGADLALGWLDVESEVAHSALFVGVLLVWYLGFGYLSRRFELEADLVSLELIGDSTPLVHALEQVGGAHARERDSWRHFSTASRVRFLEEVRGDPSVGERLRAKLRLWSLAGFLAMGLACAAQAWSMAQRFDEDRIVVDLRLGRYERAQEQVGEHAGADLEQELLELVERSRDVRPDERSPERLGERARRALERGDPRVARELVTLALLRSSSRPEELLQLADRIDLALSPDD